MAETEYQHVPRAKDEALALMTDLSTPLDGNVYRDINAILLKMIIDNMVASGYTDLDVVWSRGPFKSLKDRLDAGDKDLRNISVDWINKNLGKLDQTFMTEEFLQQMAGNTPINAVPGDGTITFRKLAKGAVAPDATSFFEYSNNRFDKSKVELDKSINAQGQPSNATGFVLSGFVRVKDLTSIIIKNIRNYAFFDEAFSHISGSTTFLESPYTNRVISISSNHAYIRFAWLLSNESLATQQLNTGNVLMPYDEYFEKIPKNLLQINDIRRSEVDFYVPNYEVSKNLHSVASTIDGYYINQATGELTASSDYQTFESTVKGGERLTFSLHNRSAFYDSTGGYIGGSGLLNNTVPTNSPLTRQAPPNASIIKYSLTKTVINRGDFQLEYGSTKTAYEKPGFKLPELIVNDDLNYMPDINLPNKVYATVGEELKIYNANIIKDDVAEFNIDWRCDIGKQMKDYYSVTPSSSGSHTLTFNLYRKSVLVEVVTTNLIVSAKRTNPISYLEIGDSTTHAAGQAYAVKRLKSKLGANLTTLGTQQSGDVRYEGRGGWKAETWRSTTEYLGQANPFYNTAKSDFDFAYYMAQQGHSGVNVVVINLGINDVFGQPDDAGAETQTDNSITHTDFIIASILDYDPTIKIALNIPIPPNAKQDVFGTTPEVALFQTQWRAKYNNFIYAQKFIDKYQGMCDLLPIHAVIDTENNLNDHVHPTEMGYYEIGDQKYNYINSLQ